MFVCASCTNCTGPKTQSQEDYLIYRFLSVVDFVDESLNDDDDDDDDE